MNAARKQVFLDHAALVMHFDLALAAHQAGVFDHAVDFGNDGRLLGFPRFEKLDDARQTSGDILGFARFARNLGQDAARKDLFRIIDPEMGFGRKQVALDDFALVVPDADLRLIFFVRGFGNDLAHETGVLIALFLDRNSVMNVFEYDGSAELGKDGEGVRIPFHQHLARFDLLSFFHLQNSAVRHRVAFLLAAGFIRDDQRAVAVHDHQVSVPVGHVLNIQEFHDTFVLGFFRGLFVRPACRTADMERSHRQLRAGFADRLGGNDAGRFAQIHHLAGCQVAPIAFDADAALGLAGQHGPDLHLLDAGCLNIGCQGFRDFLIHSKDGFTGERIFDDFQRNASDDTVAQRLDDFAAFDDGRHIDAVQRIAVHAWR